MKFKPLYIYIVLIIIIVLSLVFYLPEESGVDSANNSLRKEVIPEDDIHKGLTSAPPPSKDNVSVEARSKLEMLEKDVNDNPDDTLKMKDLARMLAAAHRPNEAISYFEQILVKDSARTDILLELTFLYYQMRDLRMAEDLTNRILRIDGSIIEARYNLGAIAAAKGDKEKARSIWTEITIKFPNSDAAKIAQSSLDQL